MSDSEMSKEQKIERLAMNIVFQIGDALYEALPADVAHEHFVTARQATNDMAIDFAAKLITKAVCEGKQSLLDELDAAIPSKTERLAEFIESRHIAAPEKEET